MDSWSVLETLLFVAMGYMAWRSIKQAKEVELIENKNFAKINGKLVDLEKSIIAEAELVKTSDYEVFLVYNKLDSRFLTQGATTDQCLENLRVQFPNKDIYLLEAKQ